MDKFDFKNSFLLFCFVFLFFLVLFLFTEKRGIDFLIVKIIYSFFIGIIAFFIFYTGEISKFRSLFFITSAIGFIIFYKFKLWGLTKNIFIAPQENIPEVPICHIALASNFFITFFDQIKAIFLYNWEKWGFYTLGIVYIFSTISIGQGFCSWVCFYGGIDESMSKIVPKQILKINNLPTKVRDFPIGFLIFLLLSSIILFEPVYCLWFCPLKMTTAILNKGDLFIYKLQIAIFIFIGIVFLILLPLLTKKRTFCSFLCPFGAFISIVGKINPFKLKNNIEKCIKCDECKKVCPNFAINNNFEITDYCVKCFKCVNICPKKSIEITFMANKEKNFLYVSYLLSGIILGGTISSFFVPEAILILFKLWI